MIQLSFRNRIALNYILITGLLILVVFSAIYLTVKFTVYKHLDENLRIEIENHLKEIKIEDDRFILIDEEEWEEREHNSVDVNPVFVQFLDVNKKVIEKSPNLKNENLVFHEDLRFYKTFDTTLLKSPVRQIQVPLEIKSNKIGYLIIAMPLTDSAKVLNNLFETLLITFPVILVLLFLIARFFAGRSIRPINAITDISGMVTKDNLKARIPLPKKRDELYTLSETINSLLSRIEDAVEREKQFTSDASHELRTPLTVIKGTLEVLVRKPRNNKEYEEKINYCINEVDHLNILVDQLLMLARFENQRQNILNESVYLNAVILDVITLNSTKISSRKLNIKVDAQEDYYINSDNYLIATILRNIISNAVKYTNQEDEISISLFKESSKIICKISDNGIGIEQKDLEAVFNPFFRSNSDLHPEVKGTGLGLSIVKRFTELLGIKFQINSKINEGTEVILEFNEE
ncbi:sensor histidine kinase [Flavobacterium sp. RS13.1]|uniref:sensor histidine kinase n=1 Tax=Flavobacterium sp. RS13.1 TaxID=3400345 RepID=UPI003AAB8713